MPKNASKDIVEIDFQLCQGSLMVLNLKLYKYLQKAYFDLII